MTNAPTIARAEPPGQAVPADVTAMDLAARGPLLLLIGSGIAWLVISGLFALIGSIQLYSPHFLDEYSFLTHGRIEALRDTAFVYGWAANAGLAVALWILGRLGGNLLRATNWVFAGASFWNVGVTAGLVGIAIGDMTSFSLFELPRYVLPIMLVAYGAISISGVLAWAGRRTEGAFAAQWYAFAALFLFPWLCSAAQVVLLWSPVRGVVQNVAANWCAQGVWSLWLVPMALASAYYLATKVSGRVLPHYEFAPLGFWLLIFVGSWTGGRHLIGGPVPAWIITMAVVATVVLLAHYAIVALNLGVVFGARGAAASFIRFGLIAYVLGGAFDALTAFRGVAEETQFTFVTVAIEQLALYGGISMMFFGGIYYLVPRLTNGRWASAGLAIGHRLVVMFGVIVLVVTLGVAGWTQGVDLLDPKTSFTDIFEHVRLTLLIMSGAQLLLLGANLLLLVNFLQTITSTVVTDVVAMSPLREDTEVTVS
ncbi:MAG TPA: cbb3-type cytochrome c oxidase subunit I [Opitutaceae bacterium]|nr:cbb3-type cytochrome c oxidase subunit I [Opitutaceae bacterium]